MIKFERTETSGWEPALRGMRNPMNSWDKSDTVYLDGTTPELGYNDSRLAKQLAEAGSTHAKYRRMITVYTDITAPLYWWKQFDTYKVGTVTNSCSTMHKITEKPFTLKDFSTEHLNSGNLPFFDTVVALLEYSRKQYLQTKDKSDWWQLIQMLPESYNQRRTVMLNYEVLAGIYETRRNHKLDEWHDFCDWIESLPYSEVITCGVECD